MIKTCCIVIALAAASTGDARAGDITLYFSRPGVADYHPSPEDGLAALIDSARESFHGAFYDISSRRIADCLIAAKRRGVDVRLVTERDTRGPVIEELERAGIPVVCDDGPGLMHNKFAVVDGVTVWTGSYNATPNGAGANDNNALALRSPELAALYLREFREMFEDGVFGNRREGRPFSVPRLRRRARVEGAVIRAYFAPEDRVERIIARLLRRARSEVRFLAFTFTSNRLADEMLALRRRGIAVSGVFERGGALTEFSEYMKLRVEGVDARLDASGGLMHHKVIIIDGRIVITGSFNFTRGADMSNDENVLVIESAEVAREYLREFARLHGAASVR